MSTTSGKGSKVPYRCSFCGKSQEQVRKLIAGQGVYICDECIHLCQEIIEEEMLEAPKAKPSATKLPDPRRIKEALDGYVISQERAKRVLAVSFGEVERHRLVDGQSGAPRPAEGREVRAGSEPNAQVVRERTDVEARGTLHREGEVVSTFHTEGGVRVRARLSDASAGRLAEFVVAPD